MFTLDKTERLCSQKLIDTLFHKGRRIMVFPYSITLMACEETQFSSPAQVLISTSKKKFHHAVDRNRVKRLTRECYRLHKPTLYKILSDHNVRVAISINYIHNEILDYGTLCHKFDKILIQIDKALSNEEFNR